MHESFQQILLASIIHDWQTRVPARQPWGVWIRAYPSIADHTDHIPAERWPHRVWFLDRTGCTERDIFSWRRFQVVVLHQIWCRRSLGREPIAVFGDPHELGLAAFAPYQEGTDVYLETIWGNRDAQGRRVQQQPGGYVTTQQLWVA
jgi:hypothetical protein